MASSLPVGQSRTLPHIDPFAVSERAADYVTVTSSARSATEVSVPAPVRKAPLAFAGIRHRLESEERLGQHVARESLGQCSQVVMISCLHLSHEQAHTLGRFAWTHPSLKDPTESTLRIMKRYADQIAELNPQHKIDVRKAPDPSKNVIQHHMLKAREAAGLNSYVVAFYGGHGVQEPPTEAGELWCYDRSFEQCAESGAGPSEYIPVLLFDFFSWCGSSTCYVWDCQKAGRFLKSAIAEAAEVDSQLRRAGQADPQVARLHPPVYSARQIHFAACGPEESIPHIPGLPNDLFTSCLQTPLRVALLYHNSQTFPLMATHHDRAFSQRAGPYMEALYHSMSADLKGRLWKEMQALLSTIAWHVLDAERYQFLFGHGGDLISNLACGFLLAQRVMSSYHATPESIPHIPWSASHSLWTTWDLMLDSFFEQLPPYFDEDVLDYSWEADLRLVSFIGDQLQGVFTPDLDTMSNNDPVAVTGLSRIPIMCSAALFPEHRQLACESLATCLRSLNLRNLAKAVQGGALDVAFQLLAAEEHHGLAPQIISIWASLVRDPTSIALLSTDARTVERLSNLSSIKFLLDHLEEHANQPNEEGDKQIIIQTAVVLATIATNVGKRTAPHFVTQALRLTGKMLAHSDGLVQQWGALLLAELNAGIQGSLQNVTNVELKSLLIGLVKDRSVDTRATAVYALARGIPIKPVHDIMELEQAISLAVALSPLSQADGSPIVRKEIVGMSRRVMTNAGCWTTMVLIIFALQLAIVQLPEQTDPCLGVMAEMAETIDIRPEQQRLLCKIEKLLNELTVVQHDPDLRVVKETYGLISRMMGLLKPYLSARHHDAVFAGTFPAADYTPVWTLDVVEALKRAGLNLVQQWDSLLGQPNELVPGATNDDLFEMSRMSLQEHLARHQEKVDDETRVGKADPGPSEKTYIKRHRLLEDSMVVAEQQGMYMTTVGLPWKWRMKDIAPADPWTTIACHSFDSILLACDDSHDVVFWDWGLNRKTGSIKLNLAPNQRVTSARFVNELHPSNIVLAEISNGVMHVLSGETHDPKGMRSISSFLALDVMRHNLAVPPTNRERGILSSSWWRQTGRLIVGGASQDINVWDCPAERCVKTLKTNSDYMITRVIHEPISGNIILTGFENGEVKLYDLRQSRATSLLEWDGSVTLPGVTLPSRNIRKVGMALGVSSHVSSAAANGMINVHDLRNLSEPLNTVHAQPHGIASASFQAHSGLMSTLSYLHPSRQGVKPTCTFGMYRIISSMTTVTEDEVVFDTPPSNVVSDRWAPYAVMHPLRPWVGLGYGSTCHLRGSGVGQGDDTDSGSWAFLKSQEQFAIGPRI